MLKSAQGQLRRFDVTAHRRPSLQHDTTKAGFHKIRRSDQAIVSGAGNNNIESIGGSRFLPQRRRLNSLALVLPPAQTRAVSSDSSVSS